MFLVHHSAWHMTRRLYCFVFCCIVWHCIALCNREVQRAAKEEEVAWDVKLKHVEGEEQKSPSPEDKPKPASPEIERLEYHPGEKRERPEVGSCVILTLVWFSGIDTRKETDNIKAYRIQFISVSTE